MNTQEFEKTYCSKCGFSPCQGPHTEHFGNCRFKYTLSSYDVCAIDNDIVSKEDVNAAWEKIYNVLIKHKVDIYGTIDSVSLNKVYVEYGYNSVETIYSMSVDTVYPDRESNIYFRVIDDNNFSFNIACYNRKDKRCFYYYNSTRDYFVKFAEDSYLNLIL